MINIVFFYKIIITSFFYYGNRTSKTDIKDLYLNTAKEIYVVGESIADDGQNHDAFNMDCLRLITSNLQIPPDKNERKNVYVIFENQITFSSFQFSDISADDKNKINYMPLNYYEMWAQKVFINQELDKDKSSKGDYLPLEGVEGIKYNDEKHVHLFIVGMSRMGIAMGIEAAHLAHYPNYEEKGIRTKITFIDKNAVEEKDFFMGRFKELFMLSHWRYGNMDGERMVWQEPHVPSDVDHLGGDFLDIEWEFINGGIEQTPIQDYILTSANSLANRSISALCR